MKDKITISYILITVVMFGLILVYFANMDFKENNSRIENKSVEIFKKGKHYSEKLYDMVAHTMDSDEESSNITAKQDRNTSIKQKKFVFSTKIKDDISKPLIIKKDDNKKKKKVIKLATVSKELDTNKTTVTIKDNK